MPGKLRLVGAEPSEFDRLYQRYPRKEGKTAGRKTFDRLIKQGWTPQKMHKCLDNYLKIIEQYGRSREYIKLFSTFMNAIEDYEEGEEDAAMDLANEILNGQL